MTEFFYTKVATLDEAAMYKARMANVERDRLLDETARLRELGDALAAAVTALVSCRFDVPTGVVGVDFYALAQARDAARAWREARG